MNVSDITTTNNYPNVYLEIDGVSFVQTTNYWRIASKETIFYFIFYLSFTITQNVLKIRPISPQKE